MKTAQTTSCRAVRPKPIRVAQYVRMSTDHQKYSIENQSVANHAYAASRGMEIVQTYADAGKSGLTFARRDALKNLLRDAQAGNSDFQAVLVYDVSRWGRFQDTDESGYYEYICKRAGIEIHYCAEQFENDGSIFSAIVKSIKRAMAAEYSRELSVKAFAGQSRIARLGFRVGASPAYGTRRLLVDHKGNRRFVLRYGEYKNLQTDRVVTILGTPEEVRTVQWIFSEFVKRKKLVSEIVEALNAKGVSTGTPRPWTHHKVKYILRNEIYLGRSVWNRSSTRLSRKKSWNPPNVWLRIKCSFGPIITQSQFDAAQRITLKRRHVSTKEEILEALRRLYQKHGFIDSKLIKESNVPGITSIRKHFGGMRQVHKILGSRGRPGSFYGLSNDEILEKLRRLLKKRGRLTEVIIDKSKDVPSSSMYQVRFGSLRRAYQLIRYVPDHRTHQGSWIRTRSFSDAQLLESLRKLLDEFGYLTEKLIDRNGKTATTPTYCGRFGSLKRAYELIGYTPPRTGKRANLVPPRDMVALAGKEALEDRPFAPTKALKADLYGPR